MPNATSKIHIPYTSYLNPEGKPTNDLPNFAGDRDKLVGLYRHMVRSRRFDYKAISLQRTGRIASFVSSLGHEAVHVGLAAAMVIDDVLLPTYRDATACSMRCMGFDKMLLFFGGDERGNSYEGADNKLSQDFPQTTPIATQTTHAVGVAYAFKLRGEMRAALTITGDGGTSKGDFLKLLTSQEFGR